MVVSTSKSSSSSLVSGRMRNGVATIDRLGSDAETVVLSS